MKKRIQNLRNNAQLSGKKNGLLLFGLLLLLTVSVTGCTDWDDNEPAETNKQTIKKGSELFGLLETVTAQGDNPVENTVCIDFVYPFKVFIYDANQDPLSEVILYGDLQFSGLLGQLPADQSISLSYPLQTTLPDGTVFTVNNNAELKIALDSCDREDIISYCSGLFGIPQGSCVWEVPYLNGGDNTFAGAVFTADASGTISLYHLNATYNGTWIFLYLNDELHLNINLSGNSPTVQNWNYNFKVVAFTGDLLQLQTPTLNRNLVKSCASNSSYTIGQSGPGGGIIAYDKGSYSNGWRYIEAASIDSVNEEWGCVTATITHAQFDQIGTGYQNTVAIANYHNDLVDYYTNPAVCSSLNNGTLAAKTALAQIIGQQNDWSLPSLSELQLLYNNLHNNGLGNFSNSTYWSATEESSAKAKCIDFNNGQIVNLEKNSASIKTRLIRYF